MTFDLDGAQGDDYERGYDALLLHGLSRVSAQKKLRLPYSSVLGETEVGQSACEIRDALTKILADATGKKVEQLIVAVVDDWACNGNVDKELWMQELETLVEGFQAAVVRLGR